jgi:GTP-binding protein
VREARATIPEPVAYAVHRPAAESFRVEKDETGSGFVVIGREAERAVALNDLTNPEAVVVIQDRLKRLGVDRALARAGAKQGDRVRIGGLTFDYDES